MSDDRSHVMLLDLHEKEQFRYSTIRIPRACVIRVEQVPDEVKQRNQCAWTGHCRVVTTHGNYVVQGSEGQVSDIIWPAPPKCPHCKRSME